MYQLIVYYKYILCQFWYIQNWYEVEGLVKSQYKSVGSFGTVYLLSFWWLSNLPWKLCYKQRAWQLESLNSYHGPSAHTHGTGHFKDISLTNTHRGAL